KVSILIPVKNSGDPLKRLLASLREQEIGAEVEILIADSGSTDGSIETAKAAGARVLTVRPEDFSHGGTRNLLGREASGELLIFIVDDVLPSGKGWLAAMASALEANPAVAALSSRQITTPQADLYSRIYLPQVYKDMEFHGDIRYGLSDPALLDAIDNNDRRRLGYLDTVSMIVRKEVFDQFGFAELKNAEDIELGQRLIRSGAELGFMHSAPVYHWHEREPAYFMKRTYLGVETFSEHLKKTPTNLQAMDIKDYEGLRDRVLSLYAIVNLSSRIWLRDKKLLAAGIEGYLRAFGNAVETLGSRGFAADKNGLRNPSLDAMFAALFPDVNFAKPAQINTLSNHLFVNFSNHLKLIIAFLLNEGIQPEQRPDEFVAALYRTAATIIGECLGEWALIIREQNGKCSVEQLDRLMEQGVCYT
ncbi:MAG: glycosyltransferase, partial [Elusimicrobiota bacterium]